MPVRVVSQDATEDLVTVLCDAFADYPVMRYVLGDAPDYPRRLRTLVGLFTAARESPLGMMLGAFDATGSMVAGALVDLPGTRVTQPLFERHRAVAWAELGSDARARYDAYGVASHEFDHGADHHHLGMIGVRSTHQGSGLGRVLLEYVHTLSHIDPGSAGVSLTTELPKNVGLYQHFGYELVGHARVAPELETWSFFRPSAVRATPIEGALD